MKITVTQTHIKNAKRMNLGKCPIALALHNYGWKKPLVRYNTVSEGPCGLPHRLPPRASAFICRFDRGKPVKPFTFELDTD
jgi:hypothetical protein